MEATKPPRHGVHVANGVLKQLWVTKMDQPVVGWLERPKDKVGLDNLGTQQPCVFIYTRLLPGVTNVTDRVVQP